MKISRIAAVIAFVVVAGSVAASAQANPKSPHETADVTLGGKQVTIHYARPSMRGRKIMGGLVPYGKVWRTGADDATMLETPVDLTIGGTPVPAGKYTLWTLPSEGAWKLIINKQTGQWGTKYDESQDLGRVDMRKSSLEQPMEQFTISWKKRGEDAADLVMEWESTRASVEVRTK